MSITVNARAQRRLFLGLSMLCTAAYFVSYVSRINLSAAMVELVACGFAEKTTVALALSVNFITYGAGQIVSGYLGDRYKPQNVMLAGFILAALMNWGVALLKDQRLLILLWGINGFAQSLMWPPLVRILSQHLNADEYTLACKWVNWGGALGTMAVYASMPLLISIASYHAVFFVSGGLALGMAVVWKLVYERYFSHAAMAAQSDGAAAVSPSGADHARLTLNAVFLMGMVMIAIVMQGALRDGVTNWLPTLVSESFGLSSAASILSGVLLPVFNILCSQITTQIYRRSIRNELLCSGVIFALAVLAAALLALLPHSGAIATVILLALLVGCMHGVNFLLVCIVPSCFARYGHISLISGIFNSSTYVGSAISTYGIAVFSQKMGWNATIWLWAAIAGCGMVICLLLFRRWKRFQTA